MSSGGKVRLEGWLLKKKSGEKMSAFFKQDNLRWFRIQEVEGSDQVELALCYYQSRKDKEAKGWVYLKDITEIRDEKKSFLIVSPARTMSLEAQSQAEHVLWLNSLMNSSPLAGSKSNSRASSAQAKADSKSVEQGAKSTHYSAKDEEEEALDLEREMVSRRPDDRRLRENDRLFSRDVEDTEFDKPRRRGSREERERSRGEGGDSDAHYYDTHSSAHRTHGQPSHPSRAALASKGHSEDHRLQGIARGVGDSASGRLGKFITGANRAGSAGREREGDLDEEVLPEGDVARERGRQFARQELTNRRNRERERQSDSEEERDRESESGSVEGDRETEGKEGDSDRDGERQSEGEREGDRVEKIAITTADSLPAKKPIPMPSGAPKAMSMPTTAPPRRARDALAEVEAQRTQRRNIDDVLFRSEREKDSAADAKSDSQGRGERDRDSSDEEDFDFKAEARKYGTAGSESTSSSRPPRPAGKPTMQVNTANTTSGSTNNRTRMGTSTPPRPGGNAGTQVDQGFVTDDWDEGMDCDSPRNEKSQSRVGERDEKQTGSDNNTNNRLVSSSAGVNVDANWLDEDFDN